ncbi:MAG: hypothetical protein IJ272_07010 [Clostridia bacterium]|nr:hypothetical protein [Clostridia bacterium]
MITWMFDIGVYFSLAAIVAFIVGMVLTFTHPVKFINKRPSLPIKWFIGCFSLFAISFSWMLCGM